MNKKTLLTSAAIIILAAVLFIAFKSWGGSGEGEIKDYDAAIILKDQSAGNSAEDLRSSLKAGDVALIRESGRGWTDTEKRIYLIIKMRLPEARAARLTEPETRELKEKEALESGRFSEEMIKDMPKEEKAEMLKETVKARQYRVALDRLDYEDTPAGRERLYADNVFGWEIVEEKE